MTTYRLGEHEAIRRGTGLLMLLFTLVASILVAPTTAHSQQGQAAAALKHTGDSASVFLLNEDLTYNVSYMGISLGSVRTVITQRREEGDDAQVTAKAYIRSYSGVPFVHIHETDETIMDSAGIPSLFHSMENAGGDKWKFITYAFDQPAHQLIAKENLVDSSASGAAPAPKIDTVSIDKNCVDGLSLLFFARLNALRAAPTTVPTFIKGKEGKTVLNFQHKITSEDIDAVDYPVDVIEVEGDAQISGVLGMSGAFTGWFSNDSARVPIKGKVKIFLGSITIELKKWQRPGWTPPRAPKH